MFYDICDITPENDTKQLRVQTKRHDEKMDFCEEDKMYITANILFIYYYDYISFRTATRGTYLHITKW